MSSIFIQIASYRDQELLPTIRDCIKKSSSNHQLSFGIVWQKDDTESLEEFTNDPRFKIIDIPWQKSKGLGHARSLTQSLYSGEDYTLQIDSHHRFAPSWDQGLIDMMVLTSSQSDKPLLTAYAGGYDPLNDTVLNPSPCKVLPHDFKSSGTIWFNPVHISNYQSLSFPLRARLVSGHYFFTLGIHCKEYVYDPDLYFAGDEIALSVRSYTLGYDLYHPHICYVWHFYGRHDKVKHWCDHTDQNKSGGQVEMSWGDRDIISKKRIRQLLGEEDNNIDLGVYGCGNVRSLGDYEKYAGFDFKNRRIHSCAIRGDEPPVIYENEIDYENAFKKTTPININDWPIDKYLEDNSRVDSVKVDFSNLGQRSIYSENISVDKIRSFTDKMLKMKVVADSVPMKVTIIALDSGGIEIPEVARWERDLGANIHWN